MLIPRRIHRQHICRNYEMWAPRTDMVKYGIIVGGLLNPGSDLIAIQCEDYSEDIALFIIDYVYEERNGSESIDPSHRDVQYAMPFAHTQKKMPSGKEIWYHLSAWLFQRQKLANSTEWNYVRIILSFVVVVLFHFKKGNHYKLLASYDRGYCCWYCMIRRGFYSLRVYLWVIKCVYVWWNCSNVLIFIRRR